MRGLETGTDVVCHGLVGHRAGVVALVCKWHPETLTYTLVGREAEVFQVRDYVVFRRGGPVDWEQRHPVRSLESLIEWMTLEAPEEALFVSFMLPFAFGPHFCVRVGPHIYDPAIDTEGETGGSMPRMLAHEYYATCRLQAPDHDLEMFGVGKDQLVTALEPLRDLFAEPGDRHMQLREAMRVVGPMWPANGREPKLYYVSIMMSIAREAAKRWQ